MFFVVMTDGGHRTTVFAGTEKAALKRCEKFRSKETSPTVGYSVVQGSVTSSEHRTVELER